MRRRRQSESGFALLMLMVAAAVIAVMLYREMPRVVFEGQRQKEELLIARGEQYYRAIQLFSRKMGAYPPTIEALENTNNTRFLRRRYKDPMTGKDDWRLIHAGPGGVFIDSLTRKAPQIKDAKDAKDLAAAPRDTAEDPNAPAVASVKMRKRASDTAAYQNGGALPQDPYAPSPEPSYAAPDSSQQQVQQAAQGRPGPANAVPQPGQPYPMAGQPFPLGGQPQPGPQDPNAVPPADENLQQDPTAQAGQLQADTGQGETVQIEPQPAVPAQNLPVNTPQAMGASATSIGVAGGLAQPGFQSAQAGGAAGTLNQGGAAGGGLALPSAGNNSALDSIQRQLTGPRLGSAPSSGQMLGGGIAGVATKFKGEGIRTYKEKTKYTEWEFLYDPRTDFSSAAGRGMPAQSGFQNTSGAVINRNTQ
jgi:type II secretory pathway pseudopilin PulG